MAYLRLRKHSRSFPLLVFVSCLTIHSSLARSDRSEDTSSPSTAFEASLWRHLADGRLQWGSSNPSASAEPSAVEEPQPAGGWSSLLSSWRNVLPLAAAGDDSDSAVAWDPAMLSGDEQQQLLADLLSRSDSPLNAADPPPSDDLYGHVELQEDDFPRRRELIEFGSGSSNGSSVVASFGLKPRGLSAGPSPADINGSLAFRFASVKAQDWVDWRMTKALAPVAEQGECASSWALAAADAIASMWAVVTAAPAAPLLDAARLCNCAAATGASCCDGGWTEWALSYALYGNGFTTSDTAADPGAVGSCDAAAADAVQAKITGWERVPAMDVASMQKAVSQQPIIAFLSASSDDFVGYTGGFYNGGCGADVNHAVLIVGYGTDPVNGAYWIVKNTWGTAWGDQGFMKLAVKGGVGKCGINQIAPIYPVYYPDSPPATSFPVGGAVGSAQPPPAQPYWAVGWKAAAGANPCASPINPCGGGKCSKSRSGLVQCSCPAGFVEVAGVPTSKCVPSKRCSSGALDPCGGGTCTDSKTGGYTCVCDQGYIIGASVDGSPTCVAVAGGVGGSATYTTVWGDTCADVATALGLDQPTLISLNPFLDCTQDIPAGLVLAAADATTDAATGCAATRLVSPGDTCSIIASKLRLSLAALKALNPGLDCARLFPRQQLCAKLAKVDATASGPACGLTFTATGADTCVSIRRTYGLSVPLFTSLNPALRCIGALPAGLSVCVSALSTTTAVECTTRYAVQQGDSCAAIAAAAGLPSLVFQAINPGIRCEPQQLQIGQSVCIASPAVDTVTAALPTAPLLIPYTVTGNDSLAGIALTFFTRCGTSAGEPAICLANGLVPCDSSSLEVGMVIDVPCAPRDSTCGCPDSVPVCGADFSTYPSYCEALCNHAVPATLGPCTPCQQACYRRSGLNANPIFQSGCIIDLNSTFCSYPTWPPPDWNLMADSPCAYEDTSCDGICADTATMLASPFTNGAQWGVFKAQCKSQCMCSPRVPCGGDQCIDS